MNIKKVFEDLSHSFPFMGEVRVTSVDGHGDAAAGLYADEEGISLIMDDESFRTFEGKEIAVSGIRGAENNACYAMGIRTVLSGRKTPYGFAVDSGRITVNSVNMMPPVRRVLVLEGREYRSPRYEVDADLCTGCKMCITTCPTKAIKSQTERGMQQSASPEFFKARRMNGIENEDRPPMPPPEFLRAKKPNNGGADARPMDNSPEARRFMAMMQARSDSAPPEPQKPFVAVPDENGKLGSPVIIIESQCIRCGECIRICPAAAIRIN